MKTLVIFILISFNLSAQIQKDKTLHFGAGILAGGITAFVSERNNKFETILLSTTASTLIAIGKEAYDQYVKKTFADDKDILWTAIGGLIGGVTITYTIKPRVKSRKPTFEI